MDRPNYCGKIMLEINNIVHSSLNIISYLFHYAINLLAL